MAAPKSRVARGKGRPRDLKARAAAASGAARATHASTTHSAEAARRKRALLDTQEADDDERALEALVFGRADSFLPTAMPRSILTEDEMLDGGMLLGNSEDNDNNEDDDAQGSDDPFRTIVRSSKQRAALFRSLQANDKVDDTKGDDTMDVDTHNDTQHQTQAALTDFEFFIDTAGDVEADNGNDAHVDDGDATNAKQPTIIETPHDVTKDVEDIDSDNDTPYVEKSVLDKSAPAWEDDDDQDFSIDLKSVQRLKKLRQNFDERTVSIAEYEQRLRNQFMRLYPTPSWANLATDASGNGRNVNAMGLDLASILASTTGFVDTKVRQLNTEKLEVTRVKDANQMAYSNAVVQSVKFHPKAPLLLTAGYDRTLRLFQVDGRLNPKVQSLRLKDMPIHQASFSADGNEVIMTGKRKFFYTFDMQSGAVERSHGVAGRESPELESYARHLVSRDGQYLIFYGMHGNIVVQSRRNNQWICNLKMNGELKFAAFSEDCKYLFSSGVDGEIYQWDMAERRCVSRFFDEGCVRATGLAVAGSGDSAVVAAGSNTGVVNVYSARDFRGARPDTTVRPQHTVMNLTTAATTLLFNPDAQILALASREKRDALKMLHVPSGRVFANWPTQQTPLGYVSAMDFSPQSDWFAIGNDKGKVLLYRLNQY